MLLPAGMRDAIALMLEGVSRKALAERAARISDLYRSGGASSVAIRDDADALAYALTRLPATYAAVRHVLGRLNERCPEFAPRSIVDLGAGTGSASWAAVDAWPQVAAIAQVDCNPYLLHLGRELARSAPSAALRNAHQAVADIARGTDQDSSTDLVVIAYTLAELAIPLCDVVISRAWRRCSGTLVIVEPGTPSGYARILRARDLLLSQAARILAPCPHEHKCPLPPGDWCHFAQRISRTRDHKLVKSATMSYEDEKFSYLIAVREQLFHPAGRQRILAQPEVGKALIGAKLCKLDGTAELVRITRRDQELFKQAKKRNWGDEL